MYINISRMGQQYQETIKKYRMNNNDKNIHDEDDLYNTGGGQEVFPVESRSVRWTFPFIKTEFYRLEWYECPGMVVYGLLS